VKTEFLKSYYTKGDTEALKTKAKKAAFVRAVQAASLDAKAVIVTRVIDEVEYVWLASARADAEARASTASRNAAGDAGETRRKRHAPERGFWHGTELHTATHSTVSIDTCAVRGMSRCAQTPQNATCDVCGICGYGKNA